MANWGSKDAQVHIANKLGRPVYVLVTPSKKWAWADIATVAIESLVIEALSAGTATPAVAAEAGLLARGINSVRRLYDFLMQYRALRAAKVIGTAAMEQYELGSTLVYSTADSLDPVLLKLKAFLGRYAATIGDGQVQLVSDENFLKVYHALEPSYWAHLCNADTLHIMIIDETLREFVSFDSGPDESWLVTPDGVVRVKYGKLWVPDRGAKSHRFPNRPAWKGIWAYGIDGAIPYGKKVFFFKFKTGEYIRYDMDADEVDDGYPKKIADGWPRLPWHDRFTVIASGSIAWFFRDKEYVRYDLDHDTIPSGYPKPIAGNWKGLWAEGFDFGFVGANNKAYFVDRTYTGRTLHYDLDRDTVDGSGGIMKGAGWWDAFNAAFKYGNKLYVFNGPWYQRWNLDSGTLEQEARPIGHTW